MTPTPSIYPLLAIDSSSKKTWVGVKTGPTELVYGQSEEDSSKSLFKLAPEQLAKAGLALSDIAAIAYCEGPGSMLGSRATAMAIRTWASVGIEGAKHLFRFTSLELGKELLAARDEADSECLIATDARRNAWNTLPYPGKAGERIRILENSALEKERRAIVTFEHFAQWTKTSATLRTVPYEPEAVFANERFFEFLNPTETATPLNLRANEYQKWIPKIHSKPSQ